MYIGIEPKDQAAFAARVKEVQKPLANYHCPETAEEYWAVVDNYWSYILGIIERFAPEFIELDGEHLSITVASTRLKEKRDLRLINFFHRTWAAAPDNGTIHLIPGWGILCDLCSEDSLVYES